MCIVISLSTLPLCQAARDFVLGGVEGDAMHKCITTLVETIEAAGPRAIAHDGRQAAVCARLLAALCAHGDDAIEDYASYVPMVLQALLPLLNARNECTLDAALDALEACIVAIDKEELVEHIALVHNQVG